MNFEHLYYSEKAARRRDRAIEKLIVGVLFICAFSAFGWILFRGLIG